MRRARAVEVQETLTGSWVPGLEVVDDVPGDAGDAGVDSGEVWLRRTGDGVALPRPVPARRVRRPGPPPG